MPVVVASLVCVGVLFGTVEVSMVAFAEERGSTSGSGLLLALVALGSAASGLVYGLRHGSGPVRRRYSSMLAALAVGLLPLLLAPSVLLMAPAALLAGVAIAPTLIVAFGTVDLLVPPAARTEGFSWMNSGLGTGVALGFAVSGAVADAAGARSAFLIALGAALARGRVVLAGRGDPRPLDRLDPGQVDPAAAGLGALDEEACRSARSRRGAGRAAAAARRARAPGRWSGGG